MIDESQNTATIEKCDRIIKLEGIFMPRIREKRQRLYESIQKSSDTDCVQTVKFVHYTSAEAALNIIKTKRLWMRNSKSMIDYRELQHGYDLLLSHFKTNRFNHKFAKTLNLYTSDAGTKGLDLFDQWWQSGKINLQTYIASVSEHRSSEDLHGRLSM